MSLKLNQIEIVNTIKLLIYKENPSLLEKVDFEADNIFLEPLLFVYFNTKDETRLNKNVLEEIMQGHFLESKKTAIQYSYNENDIAYIPNLGYFNKEEITPFEKAFFIENTNIEILKYPIFNLSNIFRNSSGEILKKNEIEITDELFNRNIIALTKAFQLIKKYSVKHYELIEQSCKKCIVFKADPNDINSFATINAHGIAFFNAYQDDYDEVFFVDDIAHQTGHIIMSTLSYQRKRIFKINENLILGDILSDKSDTRSYYVFFHALYTYYTTLLCLNNCLQNKSFNEKQTFEAIGRIGFYMKKMNRDLERFQKVNTIFGGIENVLEKEGIQIFTSIKKKYDGILKKWESVISQFNYSNQPYNFEFAKFKATNKTI